MRSWKRPGPAGGSRSGTESRPVADGGGGQHGSSRQGGDAHHRRSARGRSTSSCRRRSTRPGRPGATETRIRLVLRPDRHRRRASTAWPATSSSAPRSRRCSASPRTSSARTRCGSRSTPAPSGTCGPTSAPPSGSWSWRSGTSWARWPGCRCTGCSGTRGTRCRPTRRPGRTGRRPSGPTIAGGCRTRGTGRVKLRIHNDTLAEDLAQVKAVRKAVGDGMAIMVDANQADVADAPLRRPALDLPPRAPDRPGPGRVRRRLARGAPAAPRLRRPPAAAPPSRRSPIAGGENNQQLHDLRAPPARRLLPHPPAGRDALRGARSACGPWPRSPSGSRSW